MLFLGSIAIVDERLEDANNKNKDLKAKIYHMALNTMLQHIYPILPSMKSRKRDNNDVAALFEHKNGIELMYADNYKTRCYPVLAGFILEYKKQILLTGLKVNIQCSICYVSLKE